MNCPKRLSHVIKDGENLYLLAKFYNTTVPEIIALNVGIDPYNLGIGSSILICPGENFNRMPKINTVKSNDSYKQTMLISSMRLVWSQHIYWTRMVLISIAERLKDLTPTEGRLMQNPKDIANIFNQFYSNAVAKNIEELLTEHLQIGGQLITALREGKAAEAQSLNQQWYVNADKMADAFSSINPYYNREVLKKMLYSHLELTTQEVAMRLSGNYAADIQAFNKVEEEAMMMADFFSMGLIQNFPQKF